MARPFAAPIELLRRAKLRPTRQRMALAQLLFQSGSHRHVTAEQLHAEAKARGVAVSLATVYNALHQFTAAGLLREVMVDATRSYFDTNAADHHHFYYEETGALADIPPDAITVTMMPEPPSGTAVKRVDVIIRLSAAAARS
jgi:Fur family transcriptional regulator, iron response regulator